MSFWSWQRRRGGHTAGSAALATEPALEPVELYTPAGVIHGAVASHGGRMSDRLNEGTGLRVWLPDADEWATVEIADILFVMPPAHISPRQLRVHRRRRRVALRLRGYEIVGTVHLIAGIDLDPYLIRRRLRFLPVTDAMVSATDGRAFERGASVILVNVDAVHEMRERFHVS